MIIAFLTHSYTPYTRHLKPHILRGVDAANSFIISGVNTKQIKRNRNVEIRARNIEKLLK